MRTKPMVAMIVLASVVLFGSFTPMDATAGQKSLVGSWIVDVMPDQPGPPPVRNLVTITSDGSIVNTDPPSGPVTGPGGRQVRGSSQASS